MLLMTNVLPPLPWEKCQVLDPAIGDSRRSHAIAGDAAVGERTDGGRRIAAVADIERVVRPWPLMVKGPAIVANTPVFAGAFEETLVTFAPAAASTVVIVVTNVLVIARLFPPLPSKKLNAVMPTSDPQRSHAKTSDAAVRERTGGRGGVAGIGDVQNIAESRADDDQLPAISDSLRRHCRRWWYWLPSRFDQCRGAGRGALDRQGVAAGSFGERDVRDSKVDNSARPHAKAQDRAAGERAARGRRISRVGQIENIVRTLAMNDQWPGDAGQFSAAAGDIGDVIAGPGGDRRAGGGKGAANCQRVATIPLGQREILDARVADARDPMPNPSTLLLVRTPLVTGATSPPSEILSVSSAPCPVIDTAPAMPASVPLKLVTNVVFAPAPVKTDVLVVAFVLWIISVLPPDPSNRLRVSMPE